MTTWQFTDLIVLDVLVILLILRAGWRG